MDQPDSFLIKPDREIMLYNACHSKLIISQGLRVNGVLSQDSAATVYITSHQLTSGD
jgi:hypothetical protein